MKIKSEDFSSESLRRDILAEAKVLRIYAGFAKVIADKVVDKVNNFIEEHPVVTKEEIDNLVVKELKKYDKDLAYIYHNRDKII